MLDSGGKFGRTALCCPAFEILNQGAFDPVHHFIAHHVPAHRVHGAAS
jgi:hypothetical protein